MTIEIQITTTEVGTTEEVTTLVEVAGAGPQGAQGPTGPGVPDGGTTGQVLVKASDDDQDTDWSSDYATAAQGSLADSAIQPLDNVSELTNDANYIDASGAPVQSVNAQTGAVVLTATDVGAYPDTNPNGYIDASGAPVQSVDGLTGTVDLSGNYDALGSASAVQSNLDTHVGDTTNPHSVTKTQVGLGDVPNLDTTDAVNKAHDQNTDTKLAEGTADEVTATTLAELANAERRDAFYDTILRPSGIDIPPDVLHWPSPYRPTLNLDATVARAGAGTIYNNRGLIESVGANLLRRDYEPDTGRFRGALAEPQRTNLFAYSEQFDHGNWATYLVTRVADAGVAPDGTTTADFLTLSGSGAGTWQAVSPNTATNITISCWVKRAGATDQNFRLFVRSNVRSGDLIATDTWQRFTFTTASTGAGTNAGISQDTLNSTAEILVWGAQLEEAAYPSSYIKTEATSVTRPADTLTIPQVGDRRRGFICWEGVMEFVGAGSGVSDRIRGMPFGTSFGNIQGFWVIGDNTIRPVRSDTPSAGTSLTLASPLQNRIVRCAYWWDSDAEYYAGSVDGLTLINAVAGLNPATADPLQFGIQQAGPDATSHTNWIYISYNIPSIAEIEALTGAVV